MHHQIYLAVLADHIYPWCKQNTFKRAANGWYNKFHKKAAKTLMMSLRFKYFQIFIGNKSSSNTNITSLKHKLARPSNFVSSKNRTFIQLHDLLTCVSSISQPSIEFHKISRSILDVMAFIFQSYGLKFSLKH